MTMGICRIENYPTKITEMSAASACEMVASFAAFNIKLASRTVFPAFPLGELLQRAVPLRILRSPVLILLAGEVIMPGDGTRNARRHIAHWTKHSPSHSLRIVDIHHPRAIGLRAMPKP